MRTTKLTMDNLNNTGNVEKPGGVPEDEKQENGAQKSPEQELQEIYEEQQRLEQQEKESQALLTNLKSGREKKLRQYQQWRANEL